MFLKYLLNSLERLFVLGFVEPGAAESQQSSEDSMPAGTKEGYKIDDFFNEEQLSTLSSEEKTRINGLLEKYNELKLELEDHELASTIPKERIICINKSLERFKRDKDPDTDEVERTNAEMFLDHNKKEAEYYETVISELSGAVIGIKNEIDMNKIIKVSLEERARQGIVRINELIEYFEDQRINASYHERGIDLEQVNDNLKLLYELKYKKENKESDGKDPNFERLLKKVPNLREMGDYTYDQFENIPIYQRLQFVTKERTNIAAKGSDQVDIHNGDVVLNITFDFGGNYNENLSNQLYASMIFPEAIGKISVDGKVYTRKSFDGNFFDSDGKPLGRLKEGMKITLVKQSDSIETGENKLNVIPADKKELYIKQGDGYVKYVRGEKDIFRRVGDNKVLVLEEGLQFKYSESSQETITYVSGTLRTDYENKVYLEYLKSEPARFVSEKLEGLLEGVEEIKVGDKTYKKVDGEGKKEFRLGGKSDGEVFDPSKGGVLSYFKDGEEFVIDLSQKLENIEYGLKGGTPANVTRDMKLDLNKDNYQRDIAQMVETSGGDLSRFSTENGPIGENFKDDFMKLLKLLFPFAADFIDDMQRSLEEGNNGENPYGSFDSYGGGNSVGEELANFCKTYSQSWDKNNPLCGRNVYNALNKFGKFPGIHSCNGTDWAGQLEKRNDFVEVTSQYDCYNAPPGAVISYRSETGGSPARQKAGHVEIALGGGQYYFGITTGRPGGSDHNPTEGEYRIFLPRSPIDSSDRNGSAPSEYNDEIEYACTKTGVPKGHLIRLVNHESKWDARAENKGTHAYGLGQIIPGTWAELGYTPAQKTDPKLQLEGTARYLSKIKEQNNCTWEEALAYYNTGPAFFRANINLSKYYSGNAPIVNKIPTGIPQSKNAYFIGAIAYYNDITFAQAKTRFTGK